MIRKGAIFLLIYHFLAFTYLIAIIKNIFVSFHHSKLCRIFENFWRLRCYLGVLFRSNPCLKQNYFFSGIPFKFLLEKKATLHNPSPLPPSPLKPGESLSPFKMLFSCSMTPGNASTSCRRSHGVKDESFVRSGQENTRKPVSAKVYFLAYSFLPWTPSLKSPSLLN